MDFKALVLDLVCKIHADPNTYFNKFNSISTSIPDYSRDGLRVLVNTEIRTVHITYRNQRTPRDVDSFSILITADILYIYPTYTDYPVQFVLDEYHELYEPLTEESYFQRSTVENLHFSLQEVLMCQEIRNELVEFARNLK